MTDTPKTPDKFARELAAMDQAAAVVAAKIPPTVATYHKALMETHAFTEEQVFALTMQFHAKLLETRG